MSKTPRPTDPQILRRFGQLISDVMGIHFQDTKAEEFERKITPLAAAFGFKNLKECLEWLMNEPLNEDKIAILAHHLTVGETYFFRDSSLFQALEEKILPELIHSHEGTDRKLNIWCAACCTGEEPYSIAILLDRLIPNLADWDITILGTDINPEFLAKARKGIYKEWSFRAMDKGVRERYFTKTSEGRYSLDNKIKGMVTFQYLNLVEDSYPSEASKTQQVDIILCNNVLIYFSPETIHGVVAKLTGALKTGGMLIVSPIEVPFVEDPHLTTIKIFDSTLFLKGQKVPKFIDASRTAPHKSKGHSPSTMHVELPAFLNLPQQILEFNFQAPIPTAESHSKKPAVEENAPIAIPQPSKQSPIETVEELEKRLIPIQNKLQGLQDQLKDVIQLARTYANQGKLELAHSWCMKALAIEKLDSALYFLHASILQELNRIQEATESCKRSLYLDPDFAVAQFMMGNLLLKSGKKQEAKRHFRNTLDLLKKYGEQDVLPSSEGMTAKNLSEMITSMQDKIV